MSQVDDWSDGYTSDYLRNLNTYGPASANVPRSSIVSHQMRYQPPVAQTEARTNDTPMYTEDDARGAYVAPASGYRAPAGGGWDVNSSDANLRFSNESGGKQYRVSRTQTAKKSVKKSAKKQAQNYGSYKDQSDPLSQHILAGGSPESKPPVESVASGARDVTDQSDMYRVIGRLSSPPAAVVETAAPVPGRSLIFAENTGDNYVPDFSKALSKADSSAAPVSDDPYVAEILAKVPPEVRANMLRDIKQRKARSFVQNLFADIPWWALIGTAGSPAGAIAGIGRASEAAAGRGAAAAGEAAGRGAAAAGEAAAGREAAAAAGEAAAGREAAAAGEAAAGREAATAGEALDGQISSLVEQLRAAGIPEDQIAASVARIYAGAAGREAAATGGQAAGREAAAAGEAAAGREAATSGEAAAGREAATSGEAAADGGVSELANAGNAGRKTAAAGRGSADEAMELAANIDGLVQRIESGAVDEMDKAWIKALADQKAAGFESETINYVLDAARAAGIIK